MPASNTHSSFQSQRVKAINKTALKVLYCKLRSHTGYREKNQVLRPKIISRFEPSINETHPWQYINQPSRVENFLKFAVIILRLPVIPLIPPLVR